MIAEVVPKPNRESRNMIIVLFLVFCVGFIFGSTAAKPVEIKYGDVVQKDEIEIEASAPVSEEDAKSKMIEKNKDILVLANKENDLDSDYIPEDLRELNIPFSFKGYNEQKEMRKEAADALETMIKESQSKGLKLVGVSAFRSFDSQYNIYNNSAKMQGKAHADKYSAKPGMSEHQTGLAIDLSTPSIKNELVEKFDTTKEGIWLRDNCYKYGFIIRYPKSKEDITGYAYEPWHVRYVGKEVAQEIYDKALTLEEYLKEREVV
ncbi:MAG: M15 family metallopeptidase [Clostridium cadaveris]|uniref:D-alanyl-D-alanine carboxypeptidase n=1 Tax=Clostridium cadaveris TaxID=1529 RepID=A0A1I2MCJ8_9CLOT|nr:M15 family metallopeptidase [Clostridium cadaveris]MDM8311439.1 M15 family metallopeptidase [Clostridium cadaveris]MDY4950277.1 M15 family metallopeptidase [Clostridium cadaveris]NME65520.1 M15 family metallopeptidase [Clostridium cadaveris]PWL51577.1 MAG: D-alanyl-D-alanine carboxypeptidase family protein [Clostridium cadaveris]SFF86961.1 D-alanyl-D-alanine carboxypeptidase [Clostridium cadaveris]